MIDYSEYMTDRQKALYYEKVDQRGPGECWPWYGHKLYSGYGIAWLKRTERHVASRIAWSLHHGRSIPEGYFICHHCDNPECQNPHHLFLGLQAHNMADAAAKRRTRHGEGRPEAKLTDKKVIIARYAHANKLMGVMELARLFGVSHSTMSPAIYGKTWKHVPMPEEVQDEL